MLKATSLYLNEILISIVNFFKDLSGFGKMTSTQHFTGVRGNFWDMNCTTLTSIALYLLSTNFSWICFDCSYWNLSLISFNLDYIVHFKFVPCDIPAVLHVWNIDDWHLAWVNLHEEVCTYNNLELDDFHICHFMKVLNYYVLPFLQIRGKWWQG